MNSTSTFFEYLSVDVLSKLLLDVREATPSLLTSEPFDVSAKQLLHTVSIGNLSTLTFNLRRGVIHSGTKLDALVEFDKVLCVVGDSLRRVEVKPNGDYAVCESFMSAVFEHCTHAVELEIQSPKDDASMTQLLTRYGGRITSLDFSNENVMQLVQPGLPVDIFPCLKALHYEDGNLAALGPLWRASGESLRQVAVMIHDISDFNAIVNDMRPWCPHLESLMILDIDESRLPNQQYVDLLITYKDQLVDALVDSLNAPELRQLALHCPNLRCSLVDDEDLARLRAAAPITNNLTLSCREPENEELTDVLTCYTNLTDILYDGSASIRPVVAAKFPALEQFETWVLPNVEEMKLLARCSGGGLKSFSARLDCALDDLSIFEPLAEAYSRTLEKVMMDEGFEPTEDRNILEWIQGCLDHFLTKLTHLKSVKLSFLARTPEKRALRNALMPLRHKRVLYEMSFFDGILHSEYGLVPLL